MNVVDVVSLNTKQERGGGFLVNFRYIVTDELSRKKDGSGSFAVSCETMIPDQVRVALVQKLGYRTFEMRLPKERTTLSVKGVNGGQT